MQKLLPFRKKHAKCIEIRLLQQSSVMQTKSKSFIEKCSIIVGRYFVGHTRLYVHFLQTKWRPHPESIMTHTPRSRSRREKQLPGTQILRDDSFCRACHLKQHEDGTRKKLQMKQTTICIPVNLVCKSLK
jgi:hypothetical protein